GLLIPVSCRLFLCTPISGLLFFFSSRRRHTRFSRDWSSDVCSSDLLRASIDPPERDGESMLAALELNDVDLEGVDLEAIQARLEIGRASCRERVAISVAAGSVRKKRKNDAEQFTRTDQLEESCNDRV